MEKKLIAGKIQKFPLVAAVIAQVLVLFFLRNFFLIMHTPVSPWQFLIAQIILSALICSLVLKLPKWFVWISVLLPLCFFMAWTYLHISSAIYGFVFVLLALTFSHTLKERVPLYLSNTTTTSALIKIANEKKLKTFLDIGSGMGGVVRSLASENVKSYGVETAPTIWLISSLWSKLTNKGKILRRNIWYTNFNEYDFIYAFLSPAIMEKLFVKIKKEMRPGTIFISNSFAVPHVKPSEIQTLDDGRQTKLYIYKL